MSQYIDGFVIPLPVEKLDAYRQVAEVACQVWMEHGALEYRECVGDDLAAEKMVSFPEIAGVKDGETVVFAWIAYRSREHRDEVNGKVMADPRMKEMMEKTERVFDCARMAYGGFKTIVTS